MNLVYYHPIAIQDRHPFQNVVNPLISVIDRTKRKWPNYNYTNLFPMPEATGGSYDFIDLCKKRAKELTSTEDIVAILWSGGIDSTFILTILIDIGVLDKLHREGRLIIGLNSESIKENPVFFENFIKKKYINCVVQADQILNSPEKYGVIITGEMADNLVGSLTMKSCVDYYNDFSVVHSPYSKAIGWLKRNLDAKEGNILSEFIEETISYSPVDIVTSHDLLWYLNFNFKWQAVNFRIVSHANSNDNGNMLISKLRHFFNTDLFQQWSMAEGHHFTGSSWKDYKMPLKKHILEITNDGAYYELKTKHPSLPGLLRYRDTFDFIYEDGCGNYNFTKSPMEKL